MARSIPDRLVQGLGDRISTQQLRQLATKQGRLGKINKTTVDGIKFDSDDEADRYLQLMAAQEQGHIRDLTMQVRFDIVIGGVPVTYQPSGRQMFYKADFVYHDIQANQQVIEDFKGHRTEVFKIKKALMAAMGHTITEHTSVRRRRRK